MLIPLLLALVANAPGAAGDSPVAADIVITHIEPDRWRVDYRFDVPVTEVRLGPVLAAFRAETWQVLTPGVTLERRDDDEMLVASDSARTRIQVTIGRYADFDPGRYAAVVPFSDGGAALYLGAYGGSVLVGGEERRLEPRFAFSPLPGENVEAPAEGVTEAYVYFGPQRPVSSPQGRLVLDAGMPSWIREAFLATTAAVDSVFRARYGADALEPPLVLVGAGALRADDGGSLKGGAIGGQLVILLRGTAFIEPSPRKREIVERLVAHEVAHLWQAATSPVPYSADEPWLHEGAAEAMAISALGASGLWGPSRVDAYAADAEARCVNALAGRTLGDAVRAGAGDAIYTCGLGQFWVSGIEPLGLWQRVAARVRAGEPLSSATVESAKQLPAR